MLCGPSIAQNEYGMVCPLNRGGWAFANSFPFLLLATSIQGPYQWNLILLFSQCFCLLDKFRIGVFMAKIGLFIYLLSVMTNYIKKTLKKRDTTIQKPAITREQTKLHLFLSPTQRKHLPYHMLTDVRDETPKNYTQSNWSSGLLSQPKHTDWPEVSLA